MEFFSLMLLNLWLKYFWFKWRCTNYLIMCLEFIKQVFTCLLNGMKYKMKMHKHICKNITMVYHPKQKEQPNWKKKNARFYSSEDILQENGTLKQKILYYLYESTWFLMILVNLKVVCFQWSKGTNNFHNLDK